MTLSLKYYVDAGVVKMKKIAFHKKQFLYKKSTKELETKKMNEKIVNREERDINYIDYCNRVKKYLQNNNTNLKGIIPQIIVTMTCNPKYWKKADLTIESIMRNTIKPNKILLYLSEELDESEVKKFYQSKINRGLEIKFVKDIGPITKCYYALKEFKDSIVISVDSDIFYKYDFISNYIITFTNSGQKSICCELCPGAHIAVYDFYKISGRNVYYPEGFRGILYPPNIFDEEFFNVEVMNSLTKYNDDVWIYGTILRLGIPVVNVDTKGGYQNVAINLDEDVQENNLHKTHNYNKEVGWNEPFARVCDYYKLRK